MEWRKYDVKFIIEGNKIDLLSRDMILERRGNNVEEVPQIY